MRRSITLAVAVIVVAMGMGAGVVAGTTVGGNTGDALQQSAPNGTTNATANETNGTAGAVEESAEAVEGAARAAQNATNATGSTDGETGVIGENVRVGPLVTVTEYRWTGSELILTVRSKAPTRTTVSEVVEDTGVGATSFRIKQRNLARGETTVRISAATVTITTPGCIRENECALLSATDGSDASNPFTGYGSAPAWIGGVSVVAVMGAAGARSVTKREWDDVTPLKEVIRR